MSQEDILASVKQEGQKLDEFESVEDLLKDTQEEYTGDSQPEDAPKEGDIKEEEKETKPPQEGEEAKAENTPDEKPEPFHKHPRWQQMQDDNATLRDELKAIKEAQDHQKQELKASQDVEMPKWWTVLAGDDDVSQSAYKDYISEDAQRRKEIREELKQESVQLEEQAKEQQKAWDNYTDVELQKLTDEGLKFDRNELLKIAVEWQPTDPSTGLISMQKAYEIMEMQKKSDTKPKSDARKKIASQTSSNNKGEVKETKVIGSNNLRYKSFSSLVQEKDN